MKFIHSFLCVGSTKLQLTDNYNRLLETLKCSITIKTKNEVDLKVNFSGILNETMFYNQVFRFMQKVPFVDFEKLIYLIKKQEVLVIRSQSTELIGLACCVGILGESMQSKLKNVYPVYSSNAIENFNLQGYLDSKSMIKMTIYPNS